MSDTKNQGIEEVPFIELDPEVNYTDPELRAEWEKQFPHLVKKDQSADDAIEDPKDADTKPKDKKDAVKEPKAKEPEVKDTKELTPEELNTQAATQLKTEMPENLHSYVDEYYQANGKLSEASLEKIAAEHGYSKETIQDFIKTKADNYELKAQAARAKAESESSKAQADAETFILELHKQVGGDEEWNSMVEWAATDAPQDVLDRYNKLVEHSDPIVVQAAVDTLHAAYKSSKGPTYLKETNTSSPAGMVRKFSSKDERIKAYQDPRYGRDPAYTEMVYARTAISD